MLKSQNIDFVIKGAAHVFIALFSFTLALPSHHFKKPHGTWRHGTWMVAAKFCRFHLVLKTEEFFCLFLFVTHSKYNAAKIQLGVFADDVQSKIGSTLHDFR